MRIFSNRRRAVHLGRLPLERIARAGALPDLAGVRDAHPPRSDTRLGRVVNEYIALFEAFRAEHPAPERAPYPADPQRLANELKANCYFLDASLAACCEIPDSAWTGARIAGHRWALAVLVEYGRLPEHGNLAREWIAGSEHDCALLRATEIAVITASFLRRLGFPATAHTRDASDLWHAHILLAAGLARRRGGALEAPFIGTRFASCIVTTAEPLGPDAPLAADRFDGGLGWWLGLGGTQTWWERGLAARRPSHASRFPMERIRRNAEPTTLILDDDVPRVPKRANFFTRALHGDLGGKAQRERWRFAYKTPMADAYVKLIRAMVPKQGGAPATAVDPRTADPVANARAIKALMHYLGTDLAGACEAKRYAWYSHHEDGRPIEPYHRSAVVMLVDQGFETMEGASGDDWISGAQSMRAYMRGGEVCGVVAAFIRSLGWSARSQTNADSDVLQLPLVLLA
ncbi:MAG: Fe-S protein, partial [Betaproteobacteria bacterium]